MTVQYPSFFGCFFSGNLGISASRQELKWVLMMERSKKMPRNFVAGWWFGCHFLFSHILGIIIPIDFHIFQRGGPTTNQVDACRGLIWPLPQASSSHVAWSCPGVRYPKKNQPQFMGNSWEFIKKRRGKIARQQKGKEVFQETKTGKLAEVSELSWSLR